MQALKSTQRGEKWRRVHFIMENQSVQTFCINIQRQRSDDGNACENLKART